MARILPEETDAAARRGSAARELETLERLERELSDEYTIYHGAHWARADESAAVYGEIDFLVANRMGRLIAIEQKNGPVSLEGAELVKHYADGPKRLRAQVSRNIRNLMSEFSRRFPGRRLDVDHLFFLPDHELRGPLPATVDPGRVVDARDAHRLPQRIAELFEQRPAPASSRDTGGGGEPPDPSDVHAFLSERVEVAPNVDALGRLARERYARLSGGLATWARRLEMQPWRLRVAGTAGSGKTQLALEELRAAKAAGRTALYVCFNRPLADAIRRVAPSPDACLTFHELAAWAVRARGEPVDFSGTGAFERLAEGFVRAAPDMAASVDLLLVDEGQDFEPAWGEALLRLARPDGRCLWLEDPAQNLYRRAPMELPGWATLRSPVNHRSPHVLVTLMNMLGLADDELQAGGAIHGFDPRLYAYADDASLLAATESAVRGFLSEGHAPPDIAVITWRGLGSSQLAGLDTLAGLRTRRFTGRYTGDGLAIVSDGALQLETLFRFKGQAADCLVITEVDFDDWTEDARTRLFVALTRARLKVALVASQRATELIEARLR